MSTLVVTVLLSITIILGGAWLIRRQKSLPSMLNGNPGTNFVPDWPPVKQRRNVK